MQQLSLGGFEPPASPEHHRLFFALWPDAGTRSRLEAAAGAVRDARRPGGRWVGAHRYHLTLRFLGDHPAFPAALARAATAAAQEVRSPAFTLSMDHLGSFRNRAIPWWFGPSSPVPGLDRLWQQLGLCLAHAGVRTHDGRELVPHVTVLRDADVPVDAGIAAVTWTVDAFVLIHSRLGRRSDYEILGRWPLGPSPGS